MQDAWKRSILGRAAWVWAGCALVVALGRAPAAAQAVAADPSPLAGFLLGFDPAAPAAALLATCEAVEGEAVAGCCVVRPRAQSAAAGPSGPPGATRVCADAAGLSFEGSTASWLPRFEAVLTHLRAYAGSEATTVGPSHAADGVSREVHRFVQVTMPPGAVDPKDAEGGCTDQAAEQSWTVSLERGSAEARVHVGRRDSARPVRRACDSRDGRVIGFPDGEGERYGLPPGDYGGGVGDSGLTWALELSFGAQDADAPLDHLAFGAGLHIHEPLDDMFTAGGRLLYLTGGDAGADLDGDGRDDNDSANLHVLGLFADASMWAWTGHGSAWRLGAGAGALLGLSEPSPTAPAFFVSLGREGGPADEVQIGLDLRFVQGVVDGRDYRALTLGASMGGRDKPGDQQARATRDAFGYIFGLNFVLGGGNLSGNPGSVIPPALALHMGLPIVDLLDLRVRSEFLVALGAGRDGAVLIMGTGGPRVRFDSLDAPIYVEALVGYGASLGTEPRSFDSGMLVDVALGAHHVNNQGGLEAALRYRHGLDDDNRQLRAILLEVGMEYGSQEGVLGDPDE